MRAFVRPSVRPSVREHVSKSVKTRISAPAHPSATGVAVYPALFFVPSMATVVVAVAAESSSTAADVAAK